MKKIRHKPASSKKEQGQRPAGGAMIAMCPRRRERLWHPDHNVGDACKSRCRSLHACMERNRDCEASHSVCTRVLCLADFLYRRPTLMDGVAFACVSFAPSLDFALLWLLFLFYFVFVHLFYDFLLVSPSLFLELYSFSLLLWL